MFFCVFDPVRPVFGLTGVWLKPVKATTGGGNPRNVTHPVHGHTGIVYIVYIVYIVFVCGGLVTGGGLCASTLCLCWTVGVSFAVLAVGFRGCLMCVSVCRLCVSLCLWVFMYKCLLQCVCLFVCLVFAGIKREGRSSKLNIFYQLSLKQGTTLCQGKDITDLLHEWRIVLKSVSQIFIYINFIYIFPILMLIMKFQMLFHYVKHVKMLKHCIVGC